MSLVSRGFKCVKALMSIREILQEQDKEPIVRQWRTLEDFHEFKCTYEIKS